VAGHGGVDGTVDASATPSDSTGAAADPEEVDEAAPNETLASIHAHTLAAAITGCQRTVSQITY
jgi:hypothetical protein